MLNRKTELSDLKDDLTKADAQFMYNYACGFAIAGNKKMAMKCLKESDRLHPSAKYLKMSETDIDFLNIKE